MSQLKFYEPSSPLSDEILDGPMRVLVETRTDLVPGENYNEKNNGMLDRICQHHWQRDYRPLEDRYELYGNKYGYTHRQCWFLLDKGQTETGDVPLVWYYWNGESFDRKTQPLSAGVQARVDQVVFTRDPVKSWVSPKALSEVEMLRWLRSRLRKGANLNSLGLEFLETPERQQWLKDNIEDMFWVEYQTQAASWRNQQRWNP